MPLTFSKIRTQKVEDPVGKLFCQKNHCVKNFKVIGIEKTGNGDKIYRETKESLWITKLKTFKPLGLSIKFREINVINYFISFVTSCCLFFIYM